MDIKDILANAPPHAGNYHMEFKQYYGGTNARNLDDLRSIVKLTEERDTLALRLVSEFGDGYYDGFIDGAKHQDNVDVNTNSPDGLAKIKDAAMQLSEDVEAHRAQSLNVTVTKNDLSSVAVQLYEALQCLYSDYKALADSGDAGNWKLEESQEGIQAAVALSNAKNVISQHKGNNNV